MKENILTALKAKFPGVNANVLNRIADMFAKTVKTEEEVATALEGVTQEYINMVIAYGDSRATDAQKTAIANYEQRYGLKNGIKVTDQADETNGGKTDKEDGADNVPSWAKALIESNKKLTERLDRMDGERTTASRRKEIDNIISRLPEIQRKAYSHTSLDSLSDEEFATLKGEIASEVEDLIKDGGAKGAVFGTPKTSGSKQGGNHKEATDAEATAVVDKLNIV